MQPKSKHLPADKRRDVTVEAVIELAAEHNPSKITTAAIAKQMNVTQGALFRHFPSKDAIWQAVMMWVSEQLLARVDKAADVDAAPLIALEAMFTSHIEFISAYPGVPRMLFGELQHGGDSVPKKIVRTLLQRYAERLAVCIERGKAAGEIDPSVETTAACQLFIGVIQGLVVQSLVTGDPAAIRKKAPGVFAIYCRGIGVSL